MFNMKYNIHFLIRASYKSICFVFHIRILNTCISNTLQLVMMMTTMIMIIIISISIGCSC